MSKTEHQRHTGNSSGPDYGGCKGCHQYEHLYPIHVAELKAEWAREDAEEREAEWRAFNRTLPTGETGRFGTRHDPIRREQRHGQRGQYGLVTVGFDPMTRQRVAIVDVLCTPVRLLVFVGSGAVVKRARGSGPQR